MSIDRVARQMVDVEPSADLEARIRGRLGAARPSHTSGWWAWRVGVPIGALASLALAIGFAVQGPESRVQGPGSRVQSPESRVQGPQTADNISQPSNVPTSQPSAVASRLPNFPTSRLSKVSSRLSAEEIAWMERRIPALDPVNALQMDHLRVDSIQPEPLAITPLTMTPVGTDGAGIERRNDR